MTRNLSRLLLCGLLGSVTALSGCALVRKDSTPHQQLQPEQIKLASDIHLASQGWPQAQWWRQFNDPQLDALISCQRDSVFCCCDGGHDRRHRTGAGTAVCRAGAGDDAGWHE